MPVANRPEFMALALEKLARVQECPPVIISVDFVSPKLLEEIGYVYENFAPQAQIIYRPDHIKVTSGTWNILQAIKTGYETGADRVFLVEEDVMVFSFWKEWHDQVLATGKFLASCGRRGKLYTYRGPIYTNPGSCLTRELLDKVVPHINDLYFDSPGRYFKNQLNAEPNGSSLDDGLIRNFAGACAYPDKPVCAHQGWVGYENGYDIYANKGDIKQRIAGLREIIARIKPGDRYAQDFEFFVD